MMNLSPQRQSHLFTKIISCFIVLTLISSLVIPPSLAQNAGYLLGLPKPGTMVSMSPGYTPVIIKGVTIDINNPLRFDFIVDRGQDRLKGEQFKAESNKLIKYFLASLTVPEENLWVNLSPYEGDRIIPDEFGKTEMGRDLLAQDYLLKQITSSLIYPEDNLGKKFWDRVYEKAHKLYGTTDIPTNTFNKVWIVPERAEIFEVGSTAFIADSHLKVMLEEDYLALQANLNSETFATEGLSESEVHEISNVTSPIVKEVIIPELEKEVNTGKNFAPLRQIYHSMILAAWYKETLKESLLARVYVNRNKIEGIDLEDKNVKEKIYQSYLEGFKKGVYNIIKEDYDKYTKEVIPRKYFSGGFKGFGLSEQRLRRSREFEDLTSNGQEGIRNLNTEEDSMAYVSTEFVEATKKVEDAYAQGTILDEAMAYVNGVTPTLGERKKSIPHREVEDDPERVFSINRAIRKAREQKRIVSVDEEHSRGRLETLLKEEGIVEMLIRNGISVERLKQRLDDEELDFRFVADTKNGSPAIVMRTDKDYQYAHVGLQRKTLYFGQGLMTELMSGDRTLYDALLLRELVALDKALEIYEETGNYDGAVKQAGEFANKVEKDWVGNALGRAVQKQIDRFFKKYFEDLSEKFVVTCEEISVLPPELGRELVGGKSYELARNWALDPDHNFLSYSTTFKASDQFLNDSKKAKAIKDILENLDTFDDEARENAHREISKMLEGAKLSPELITAIKDADSWLYRETRTRRRAVRSSGRAEDIKVQSNQLKKKSVGSNAGQHRTDLGVEGDDLIPSVKRDLISLFTDSVLDYRDTMMVFKSFDQIYEQEGVAETIIEELNRGHTKNGFRDKRVARAMKEQNFDILSSLQFLQALEENIVALLKQDEDEKAKKLQKALELLKESRKEFMDLDKIAMGVSIMPMADAKLSGVAFGLDVVSKWTAMTFQDIDIKELLKKGRLVTITTTYGLGESIVQGWVNPDTYLVHIFEDENGETKYNIIGRELGVKNLQVVYKSDTMREIGLKQAVLDQYMKFFSYDEEKEEIRLKEVTENMVASQSVFAAKATDDIKKAQAILAELIEQDVEKTAEVKIADEDMKLFEFDRDKLNKLAHLIKATLHDPFEKVIQTDVPTHLRNRFSAEDSQVIKIAKEFMRAADGYEELVDIEFAVGDHLGGEDKVALLQRRPSNNPDADVYHPGLMDTSYYYLPEKLLKEAEDKKELIGDTGIYTGQKLATGVPTRNAFNGRNYVIDKTRKLADQFKEIRALADGRMKFDENGKARELTTEERAKAEKDGYEPQPIIIVTDETTPSYVPVMRYENVVGVIARKGGKTSHAAVISRELGIATVVGIEPYLDQLVDQIGKEEAERIRKYINTSGNWVTVDANENKQRQGTIYAGKMEPKMREIIMDPRRWPKIFTKLGLIMATPEPMKTISQISFWDSFSGVVLQRAEFSYTANPIFGRAYDKMVMYDYLEKLNNNNYYETLSPERKLALDWYEEGLRLRNEKREKGIVIPQTADEKIIEQFSGTTGPKEKKTKIPPSAYWDTFNAKTKKLIAALQKKPDAIKAMVKERLEPMGYNTYEEYFEATHGGAVATMSAALNVVRNRNVYRAIDFKQNELIDLLGGDVVAKREMATMLGNRGGRFLLDNDEEVLRPELRMLLERVAQGYTNDGYMFPFVSTPEELHELMLILEDEERKMSAKYGRPIYLREAGMMVELPSNVTHADEFAAVLRQREAAVKAWFKKNYHVDIVRDSFFSFGTNDLTQLMRLFCRDNPIWTNSRFFNEGHPNVIRAIRHVVNVAKEYKIKCGLCGNAIVNLMSEDPEAAKEILVMLGETGGYAGVDYLGVMKAGALYAQATLDFGVVQDAKAKGVAQFTASIDKGAAARPLYKVSDSYSIQKELSTSFGDFVLLNPHLHGLVAFTPDEIEEKLRESEIGQKLLEKIYEKAVNAQEATRMMYHLAAIGSITIIEKEPKYTLDEILDTLSRAGAIMVEKDSPQATLFKEILDLGVPVVEIGNLTIDALSKLNDGENGHTITLDFKERRIYDREEVVKVVVPPKPSEVVFASEEEKEPAEEIKFDVAIKSADYYQEKNIHPVAFLKAQDQDRKAAIKELVGYWKSKITDKESKVVFETLDLTSDKLLKLKGAKEVNQSEEITPPMGYVGFDTMVQDAIHDEEADFHLEDHLKQVFTLEMEALAILIREGYDIAIQFNTVRTKENIPLGLKIIKEAGIDRKDVKIGLDPSVPGAFYFGNEYVEMGDFDFLARKPRLVAQRQLAVDLHENDVTEDFYLREDRIRITARNLARPMRMINGMAKRANIPLRTEPFPEIDNIELTEEEIATPMLVAAGDESMAVLPDAVERIPGALEKRVGGINLNPVLMDLQIKRDGNGIPLPVREQPFEDMKIDGFLPIIINVTPFDLPLIMGDIEEREEQELELLSKR